MMPLQPYIKLCCTYKCIKFSEMYCTNLLNYRRCIFFFAFGPIIFFRGYLKKIIFLLLSTVLTEVHYYRFLYLHGCNSAMSFHEVLERESNHGTFSCGRQADQPFSYVTSPFLYYFYILVRRNEYRTEIIKLLICYTRS
jgi:hypothetical protein